MNFVVFISVSLIFSTIVLALPQTGAPGSFSTIDHNTPEINKLANQALDHFVSTSGSDNSSCKQKINKILSAKSQTVAGRNVDIQMEICPDNCGANSDDQLNFKRENDLDFDTPDSDQKVGYEKPIDPNSLEIDQLAKKLLDKFDSESGAKCKRRLLRVVSVKRQVVAGIKTRMELEICPDICANGVINVSECKICDTEVWEKPWEEDNYFQIMKFECPL
ncbi:uncharacterized protein LOC135848376 [Planococcus citri]|uniref:uncharacterized protein LOC135848376 n=1 Tax=Planococcus citri TaxID=170843 RepID=UPI0031F89C8B